MGVCVRQIEISTARDEPKTMERQGGEAGGPTDETQDSGPKHMFKYLVVGEERAGKTALVMRYCKDTFTDTYEPTIGIDYHNKEFRLENGDSVKLQVWDTQGKPQKFPIMTQEAYRGTAGCVIVYNTTETEHFESIPGGGRERGKKSIPDYMEEIKRYAPNAMIVIAGSQIDQAGDRDKICGPKEVEKALREKDLWSENVQGSFLVSSRTGEGVDKPFQALTAAIVQRIECMGESASDIFGRTSEY